jgi:hypothetical protein
MKKLVNETLRISAILSLCFLLSMTTVFQVTGSLTIHIENVENRQLPFNPETSSHVLIKTPDAKILALQLTRGGYNVLHTSITDTSFEVIVTPSELNGLKQQEVNLQILAIGRPFSEIQTQSQTGILPVPPDYPDLATIYQQMEDTASDYSSICKMIDITETYNVEPTYEGRHLYALKISDNVNVDEDEPAFLMVSCHHCREIVTPVLALYAIEQLTSEYGSDPQITSLVDQYEIWISPMWNPDGYDYVFNVDNMWRKNRRYFPEFNSYGVDLNRNYPFGWNAPGSGSTDPFSETYKGPSPASEAETQTMIAFSNDRHFCKVIDYHSYGREVLYGYCSLSHPFTMFFHNEAVKISAEAGYGGSIRPPSADGEEYQWQIAMHGAYAYLMETHTQFQPSYTSAQAEAVQIWPSTLYLLERPLSLSGHVCDAHTGDPLCATINLSGITFPNGEQYTSWGSYGRYQMILPPGEYDVEFSAPGYITQVHPITVTLDSAEVLDVALQFPNDPPGAPTIEGPSTGKPGSIYRYILETTDPDNDDVYYYVDWGDGQMEEWIGPYDSGEQAIVTHSWEDQGTYIIQVKARDIYEAESEWTTLEISMPQNRVPSPFFVGYRSYFIQVFC